MESCQGSIPSSWFGRVATSSIGHETLRPGEENGRAGFERELAASVTGRLRHLAIAALFLLLTLVWTLPLAGRLSTHLAGLDFGDSTVFVWNFWWMRVALDSGLDFFRTPLLFAPIGADLTQHTHTALPAFVGATVLGHLPVVTALNVTILGSLALNFFCAYLLAWRVTHDRAASIVAAVVFGGSPYISGHLTGHFNLTTAWTLPLFALSMWEMLTTGQRRWAVLSGAIVGATAYIDYYYVVFQLAFAVWLCLSQVLSTSLSRTLPTPRRVRLLLVVGVLVVLAAAVVITIGLTGGYVLALGPLRISMRSVFNPLQVLWVLVGLWLWLRIGLRVHVARRGPVTNPHIVRASVWIFGTFALLAAPILWRTAALIRRGDYSSQEYFWRSAPKGVDAATLVLGNPWHGVWGPGIRAIYQSLGLDTVESSAWLGIAPVILATVAIRRGWHLPAVRLWTVAGALFAIWALGPHLMAFGVNTGAVLPQTVMRYVPILSNARIPGRAMVMVYMALAVLSAIGVAELRRWTGRGGIVAALAVIAIAVDYLPAPFPMVPLARPAVYKILRERPEHGAVLELPLGVRDGFGRRGAMDHEVPYFQTLHGRPITGGFTARLPGSIRTMYETNTLLSTLLRLSEGAPDVALPGRTLAAGELQANGIRFVVLNRASAPRALVDYVERILPLIPLAHEGTRSLYLVTYDPLP